MGAARVLVFPSRCVRQDEIEELVALDNQIRAAESRRDALAESIMDRMKSGFPVEPGFYSPKIESRRVAGGREWRLVVR